MEVKVVTGGRQKSILTVTSSVSRLGTFFTKIGVLHIYIIYLHTHTHTYRKISPVKLFLLIYLPHLLTERKYLVLLIIVALRMSMHLTHSWH